LFFARDSFLPHHQISSLLRREASPGERADPLAGLWRPVPCVLLVLLLSLSAVPMSNGICLHEREKLFSRTVCARLDCCVHASEKGIPFMFQLASVALHVNDLETSLHFFVDLLGFPLQERHPDGARALLLDLAGTPLLLAGPGETDLTSYLTESPVVLTLAGSDTVIGFLVEDLDVLAARLHEQGVEPMGPIEDRFVDRIFAVRDPNGYTLNFLSLKALSPEELTTRYAHL